MSMMLERKGGKFRTKHKKIADPRGAPFNRFGAAERHQQNVISNNWRCGKFTPSPKLATAYRDWLSIFLLQLIKPFQLGM